MNGLSENGTGRLDRITVAALIAVFFLCSFFSLTDGCCWGDDYAAYISEGIAISEGKLDTQSALNSIMHPSPLPDEAVEKPLVYVWGYPLILALVYRLVGFDRLGFSSVFFYKLPSVIAFALFSAVLFLFLRKRFNYLLSLLLTVAFCSCAEFYSFFNTLYSDVYFMFFSLLSLYAVELYIEKSESPMHEIIGVISGVILWYMYEIRLNGIAILISFAAAHLIYAVKEKKLTSIEKILHELVPYVVFFTLKALSEAIIASPTSNISDFQDSSFFLFINNICTYFGLIQSFFTQIWNNLLISPLYSVLRRFIEISYSDLGSLSGVFVWLSIILTVSGVAAAGIRNNIHLSLLVILYILAASILPYTQGMRYIYPILPVIFLFFGYGVKAVSDILRLSEKKNVRMLSAFAACVMCFLCLYQVASNDAGKKYAISQKADIVNVEDIYVQNAYSPCAVEVYSFIRANTAKECTIAFFTPRGLFLNTERFSIKPDVNGHSIDEADYYLDYLNTGEYNITPELGNDFEIIFSNEEFDLYKRISRS